MKLLPLFSLTILTHSVSAHYIWNTLIVDNITSKAAVRQPTSNEPVESITTNDARCNANPHPATRTLPAKPGSKIGFKLDETVYHLGPAAMYLGKAPGSVANWDGSGANWFKIAEWGARFHPFDFIVHNASQVTTTLPANTPPGEYLVRVEQVALHNPGHPEWFISCAQIKMTGNGSGNPPKVSIPGYVSPKDPGLTVNIYDPIPTAYTASSRAPCLERLSSSEIITRALTIDRLCNTDADVRFMPPNNTMSDMVHISRRAQDVTLPSTFAATWYMINFTLARAGVFVLEYADEEKVDSGMCARNVFATKASAVNATTFC